MQPGSILVIALVVLFRAPHVSSHGRLMDPASRSSMWRFGFNNPINYNDNQLFCGGFYTQWVVNHGKCGLCGDPYDGERRNEAGGKYANGIIAAQYIEGQEVEVTVELTKNHLGGYFEFDLCPVNNPTVKASEICFSRHPVLTLDGKRRHILTTTKSGIFYINVKLPSNVICTQCVFRWKYNAASSWNCGKTGCCRGCGHQEQFFGCADVSISSKPNDNRKKTTPANGNSGACQAKLPWRNNPAATPWCLKHCSEGTCPSKYCEDSCQNVVHRVAGVVVSPYIKRSRDQLWRSMLLSSNSSMDASRPVTARPISSN